MQLKRRTASHGLNDRSSRGHAIITLNMKKNEPNEGFIINKKFFVVKFKKNLSIEKNVAYKKIYIFVIWKKNYEKFI